MEIIKKIGRFIGALLAIIVFSIILSAPVMLIWNWLITDLFMLRELNIFEACGITFLCAILFKGSK